jgi:hypothetical protein
MGEMHQRASDVIGHERAAGAALLPARAEHEVLHDQLAASLEQIGEALFSTGRIKDVVLIHSHPGQVTTLRGERVALAAVILLVDQQLLPGLDPLGPGHDFGIRNLQRCHDDFSPRTGCD